MWWSLWHVTNASAVSGGVCRSVSRASSTAWVWEEGGSDHTDDYCLLFRTEVCTCSAWTMTTWLMPHSQEGLQGEAGGPWRTGLCQRRSVLTVAGQWGFVLALLTSIESVLVSTVGRRFTVLTEFSAVSCRYINHSCAPNCVAEVVTFERGHKIIISSNRRIQKGEEVSGGRARCCWTRV